MRNCSAANLAEQPSDVLGCRCRHCKTELVAPVDRDDDLRLNSACGVESQSVDGLSRRAIGQAGRSGQPIKEGEGAGTTDEELLIY